jgi:hypothetical protein
MSLPCYFHYPNGPKLLETFEALVAEHSDLADPDAVAKARKFLQQTTVIHWQYVGLTPTGSIKMYVEGVTFEKEGQ